MAKDLKRELNDSRDELAAWVKTLARSEQAFNDAKQRADDAERRYRHATNRDEKQKWATIADQRHRDARELKKNRDYDQGRVKHFQGKVKKLEGELRHSTSRR